MSSDKKECDTQVKQPTADVPLEKALVLAGCGWYSYAVVCTAGLNVFACVAAIVAMSLALPATDCDLNFSVSEKGTLAAMTSTGMIFTSHLFGYLADEYGRKYIAMRCGFASCLLCFLSAFAPDFSTLAIITFLIGAMSAGVMMPSYVYVGEFIRMKSRPLAVVLTGSIGNGSTAAIPALALLVIPMNLNINLGYLTFTSWRLLLFMIGIPFGLGAVGYLSLHETPKFLLSKRRHSETLDALQTMFGINTGKNKHEYPVKTVCLDASDLEDNGHTSEGKLKKMWKRTVSLFSKPLLKFTLISCILQIGVFGIHNVVYLWLPQQVTQMTQYANSHPEYGVTLCETAHAKEVVSNHSTNSDLIGPIETPNCEVDVSTETYLVPFMVGFVQFLVFGSTGKLVQWFGSKPLLVIFIFVSAALSFAITQTTNQWLTVLVLGATGIILAACIPISIGLSVEFFPTNVRSTATCICAVSGRIATSLAVQLMGLLMENYCSWAYIGFAVILCGIGVIGISLPVKKNQTRSSTEPLSNK